MYLRGTCFEKLNYFEKAEKDFENCVAFSPSNLGYLIHLAQTREKQNTAEKINSAIDTYLQVIKYDKSYALAYNGIGVLLDKKEQYLDAVKYFDLALDLDKSNSLFWNNKGCTLRNLDKYLIFK